MTRKLSFNVITTTYSQFVIGTKTKHCIAYFTVLYYYKENDFETILISKLPPQLQEDNQLPLGFLQPSCIDKLLRMRSV
jgi:hypothetical protein